VRVIVKVDELSHRSHSGNHQVAGMRSLTLI
jgi:hypothetical protein